jgi:alcohol dehydrogenase
MQQHTLIEIGENTSTAWNAIAPHLTRGAHGSILIIGGDGSGHVGLHVVAMAKALGVRNIEYLDTDIDRLERAWMTGARVKEGPPPKSHGSHPIAINCSEDAGALACAIRSTAPGGVCFNAARPALVLSAVN